MLVNERINHILNANNEIVNCINEAAAVSQQASSNASQVNATVDQLIHQTQVTSYAGLTDEGTSGQQFLKVIKIIIV